MKESVIAAIAVVGTIILTLAIARFAFWIIDLKSYRDLWKRHEEDIEERTRKEELAGNIRREVQKAIDDDYSTRYEVLSCLYRQQEKRTDGLAERLQTLEKKPSVGPETIREINGQIFDIWYELDNNVLKVDKPKKPIKFTKGEKDAD